jgi:hypothetical protein
MSTFLLMEWMTTGSNKKSLAETERLVKDVIGAEGFKPEDLRDFSARAQNKCLDSSETDSPPNPYSADGWIESDVLISIPTGTKNADSMGRHFTVPGLHHRPLLAIMKVALRAIIATRFHFSPFKRWWRSLSGSEVRCYDEIFTSDAHLAAHDKLQKQANEPGCSLEKVVLTLMFWSDSTHLASFGTAKVWPLYLYFGNISKYLRGKPGSGACHHVAYIPSVSGDSQTETCISHDQFIAPGLYSRSYTRDLLCKPERCHYHALSPGADA